MTDRLLGLAGLLALLGFVVHMMWTAIRCLP